MSSRTSSSRGGRKADRTAAVTLDVPEGVAEDIEAILRGFAEEAELDTVLVVDHSGFLVAGISALPEVDVDSIGKLVATAGDANETLTDALGEVGQVESLHLGEDRTLYMREIGERFTLVGVSDANIPAGILRDQASQIEPALIRNLQRVKAVPMSLTKKKLEELAMGPEMSESEPVLEKRSLRQTPRPLPPTTADPSSPPPPTSIEGKAEPRKRVNIVAKPPVKVPQKVSGQALVPQIAQKPAPQPAPAPAPEPEPIAEPEPDPMEASIFEMDDDTTPIDTAGTITSDTSGRPDTVTAVVESSPFEMDIESDAGDDADSSFQTARPNTTPVHLSVPAARKREAARREQAESIDDDDDQPSGPRYTFELG